MVNEINNMFLVNAPAGSGKTTQIKAMINQLLSNNPQDNILCITYTNRAADELSKDIKTSNVFIGTIHSFLHNFMKRYFSHQEIINLYFEMFSDAIEKRINNLDEDENIAVSNEKYKEKFGDLNYEIIKANINTLFYNESSYSSLYYGGLSHDDLIRFSKYVFDKFPIIKKRISSKYQYIFIDEYQDTSADILNIFYESVIGTNTKLFLFGDKMQQIYKNYDGSFENKFALFDTSKILRINYRSVPKIVDLLNKIYNDSKFEQKYSDKMKQIKSKYNPRVIVCNNIEEKLSEIKKQEQDLLVLYLLNKTRFYAIGCNNLYHAYGNMSKYAYGRTYNPVDILTKNYDDNPDPLIKLLYIISEMYIEYKNKQYGLIIQKLKNNAVIFNKDGLYIKAHEDKKKLHDKLCKIFSVLTDKQKKIVDLLNELEKNSLVLSSYLEGIYEDTDYNLVMNVPTEEVILMFNYLKDPKISTQHGVKGESHDSVVFVADDSTRNPVVHMYHFFEMWGQLDISLSTFQKFYYLYINELSDLQNTIGVKINDMTNEIYKLNEQYIIDKAKTINNKFKNDSYFKYLCAKNYDQYINSPSYSKAKKCLKENTVYGVLSAYKLFYVGCSRARKNLTILIERSKIKGNFEHQKRKFAQIGFDIIED